jgi:hypothetical protein
VLPRVHAVLLRMARSDPETAARELELLTTACIFVIANRLADL